jgi:hypothetical protein
MDEPGAFAMKSRFTHTHDKLCFHPLIASDVGTRRRDLCAAAQLLHGLPSSPERFNSNGTLPHAIHGAKTTVAQTLVPASIASGNVEGLNSALGRVLGVPTSFVDFGVEKRSDKTMIK